MTARDICAISHIERTKVSRAVAALEQAAMLCREPSEKDRRAKVLSLTPEGQRIFAELGGLAVGFDTRLRSLLGEGEFATLATLLRRLLDSAPHTGGPVD